MKLHLQLHRIDSVVHGEMERDRRGYFFAKRALDIVLSCLIIAISSPLWIFISIAIFLDSPRSVIFVQRRVGSRRRVQNGAAHWERVIFPCYKFRTMVANADPSIHQAYVKALIENDTQSMQSLQNGDPKIRKLTHDSRITWVGKWLRKLSLDELPQLWNVLRGDMSLVCPRPAIPYEVDMYQPWHLHRLEALPGLTGLQQVTARCTADFDEQVNLDIEYIQHQSIWLDLKIIFKTPGVMISSKGAY